MKEIFYCRTLDKWEKNLHELEQPRAVPIARILIEYPDSLYEEISDLRAVARLSGIKQLGFADTCRYSACARDTRYSHSLDFAAKIDHIAQTHELEREKAVIAAMLHDIASTPTSDSAAKGLDLRDEEQFEYVLGMYPETDEFLRKHSISKKEIINLVRGRDKSPLGQLVSSRNSIDVDRWAYVNNDASQLGLMPIAWIENGVIDPFDYFTIQKGKVVFTDSKLVSQFLEKRVKMFEDVYRNSELMAKEAFLGQITKDLLEKEVITKDSIFRMVDDDFNFIIEKYGGEVGRKLFSFGGFTTYDAINASEKDVSDFLGQNTDRPFAVKNEGSTNPAVGTPVMIDNEVKTYKEWEPWHAQNLQQRMSAWNHTIVYGYEDDRKLAEAVCKAKKHFGVPKETFSFPNRKH